MNRIDRLTAMILMLQSERLVTAEQIAEHFEISVRTVYRDMAALGEAGVPIVAEAGVGYSLMRGYHMPPVMFTEEEAVALFVSGELAGKLGDPSLKQALKSTMLKIRAVLPVERRDYLGKLGESVSVFGGSYGAGDETADQGPLMVVQEAVVRRRCLEMEYDTGGRGQLTKRIVEPLGVIFYGRNWHLIAWCRLRTEVRDFRLDRMATWQALGETFAVRDDFSLIDFLKSEVASDELIPITLDCENWIQDRVLAEIPAQLLKKPEPIAANAVRVEAMAYCLDWMARWLLGIGKGATVVNPPELRQKLVAAARELAAHHEKPPFDHSS